MAQKSGSSLDLPEAIHGHSRKRRQAAFELTATQVQCLTDKELLAQVRDPMRPEQLRLCLDELTERFLTQVETIKNLEYKYERGFPGPDDDDYDYY